MSVLEKVSNRFDEALTDQRRSEAIADLKPFLTREKIELIKQTIAKGATDTELELFVDVCNRTRLDPFARQIFAVPRYDSNLKRNTFAFQISIDGFRLIAERTGEYQGQTEPEWCGADGVWKTLWLSDEPPFAARVGVHRRGFQQPLYAIAKFKNYAQTTKEGALVAMWRKMPDHMIAKCAEALALRKAFPQDLSGLYTPDEIPEEKQVIGTVVDRQPLRATPKTREQMTQRERDLDDIRGFVVALRNLKDELFIGDTQDEKTAKLLQAVHAVALERNWQYETIAGLRDLKNEHVAEFAGWLEGRINELQEKALEAAEDGDETPI